MQILTTNSNKCKKKKAIQTSKVNRKKLPILLQHEYITKIKKILRWLMMKYDNLKILFRIDRYQRY